MIAAWPARDGVGDGDGDGDGVGDVGLVAAMEMVMS